MRTRASKLDADRDASLDLGVPKISKPEIKPALLGAVLLEPLALLGVEKSSRFLRAAEVYWRFWAQNKAISRAKRSESFSAFSKRLSVRWELLKLQKSQPSLTKLVDST